MGVSDNLFQKHIQQHQPQEVQFEVLGKEYPVGDVEVGGIPLNGVLVKEQKQPKSKNKLNVSLLFSANRKVHCRGAMPEQVSIFFGHGGQKFLKWLLFDFTLTREYIHHLNAGIRLFDIPVFATW